MANKLFGQNRFKFVGELVYNKKDNAPVSDNPLKEGSKYNRKRMNIGVKDSQNNVGYLEMSYIYEPKNPSVKIFGEKPVDIPIKDLLNPKYEDIVPSYQKITLNFIEDEEQKKECLKNVYALRELYNKEEQTDEVKAKIQEHKDNLKQFEDYYEVIHMDSAIDILNKYLPKLEGKKVVVSGRANINYYNGKSRLEYIPQTISLAKEDEKSELTIDSKIFFSDGAMDNDEENKKIFINAFMGQKYKKQDKLFPVQLIIDYSKIDLENTLHKQMLSILEGSFVAEDEDTMYNNRILIKVINSREEVEFSEETLTEHQKMMVACGLATVESFKPRGSVFGNRIQELRVIRPFATEEYANGAIVAFDLENLATYLVNDEDDTAPIKEDELKEEKPKEETTSSFDFGSLFGAN